MTKTIYIHILWISIWLGLLIIPYHIHCQQSIDQAFDLNLPFELDLNESVTYDQMIRIVESLDQTSEYIFIDTLGWTENGVWIPMIYIAKSDPRNLMVSTKLLRLWINNGIHPGEPEGIDATLALLRDFTLQDKWATLLDHIILIVVPCYNIDGMLMRNETSRVNQNGPISYGFRANANNLDLNRDFIKMKSKEAGYFNQKYTYYRPHLFLDNHTSNGADYQHTMTLIPTNKEKFHPAKSKFWSTVFLPSLYRVMDSKGFPSIPYVQSPEGDPFKGILAFIDHPRYSSGYTALHGSLSIMSETHMLKPFKDRVRSTYLLMETWIDLAMEFKDELLRLEELDDQYWSNQSTYPTNWMIDRSQADTIQLMGYPMTKRYSHIANREIREYDTNQPMSKETPYYNTIKPTHQVKIPRAYIIPKSQTAVLSRLKMNQIHFKEIESDTIIKVELYRFSNPQLSPLFEGQPYHRNLSCSIDSMNIMIHKGDYWVPTSQRGIRYILETLEPQSEDSFVRWNFFDSFLQRKEYYSDYLFEPLAAQLIQENPILETKWENHHTRGGTTGINDKVQFIYENSIYAEQQFQRYPIYRVMN
jgi:hypothetical protein